MIINPYRYAGGGGGGVPVVDDFTAKTQTTGTDIVLTAPTGIAAGKLLFAMLTADAGFDIYTTTPSGWTKLIGYGANSTTFAVFYKVATGSESDVTFTSTSSGEKIGWYLVISGNNATPIDVSGTSTNGSSFTHAITEVTTTVDNCLVIYVLSFDGNDGNPFSVSGTGWSESDEQSAGTGAGTDACWGTKEQATAGLTGNATVGSSGSDGSAHAQIAIAPA